MHSRYAQRLFKLPRVSFIAWNHATSDIIQALCSWSACTYASCILMTLPAGCLHPDHEGYFSTPADYMKWYKAHGPLRERTDVPRVALLLYRKHVITKQGYIPQLIRTMEEQGVLPVPVFINGVEAHTVVRP